VSVDEFIASQRNTHTKRAYSTDLRHWTTFTNGEDISLDILTRFRDHLESNFKSTTAVRIYNTVRTYHKWAGIDGGLFDKVKAPKRIADWVPVVPDEQDVNDLLGVVQNAKDRAIITLLLNGLRAQEVCDLKAEDFYYDKDLDAHMLRVTGKGGKLRVIPATVECANALRAVAPVRGKFFAKLNPRKVYYLFEKYGVAGMGGIHPHSLRHNYATRLVRADVDVFSVSRLLGHSRAETTQVYVNLDQRDLVKASRKDPRNVGLQDSQSSGRDAVAVPEGLRPLRSVSKVAG
jgi:site-specific recombinase XerD